MTQLTSSEGMTRLVEHIQKVQQIDFLLRQTNCILMFCQPKKTGKITLRFPENPPEAGFGIPRTPRVIQWHKRLRSQGWYYVTLPPTHLSKRAKGKDEFGAAYYHTVAALKTASDLLETRKRAVEILQRLSQRMTNFSKTKDDELAQIETKLHQAFLDHSEMRRARKPDQAEWDWFMSGGTITPQVTDQESQFSDFDTDVCADGADEYEYD